ncbi:Achaete-scute transcription factor-related [Vigna unguiculata]|uniref:Achaete-scute transcription factor-related n=1 Tax=Vigna unguiculata TaxID=3917 RepID=A0A4D6NAW0_VIGUN|nr:Achaete-scute transcription factor-related [Vigna unguiculata]
MPTMAGGFLFRGTLIVAGDSIVFLRAENGDLCVGIRRAKKGIGSMADQQKRDQPSSSIKGGGALSRGDLIDEAANYIKNLETKVKIAAEKKESLMQKKRSRSGCSSTSQAPKIEIHEMGSSLQIILTCGFDSNFILTEIIRILQEETIEVKSIHSSRNGNSMLQVLQAQVGQSMIHSGVSKVSEKLKLFVNGSICNEEMEAGRLWDSEVGTTLPWLLLDPTLDNALPPNP